MHRLFIVLFAAFIAGASPAFGQEREVPYWATIDTSELNMRVGPSVNYRIEWVYRREGLPVWPVGGEAWNDLVPRRNFSGKLSLVACCVRALSHKEHANIHTKCCGERLTTRSSLSAVATATQCAIC